MTTITAKSILASQHAQTGSRIDTLLLRYPRCIHAEFMTHRVFSRNASSSRAIPVEKLIKDVIDDPFVPLFWGKNQKGMQAGEECDAKIMIPSYTDEEDIHGRPIIHGVKPRTAWLHAMHDALKYAAKFTEAGYHKQIVNRLLEPFSHITVVVTATEWSNFLALRDHPDAEPHIRLLAQAICKARIEARVQALMPGEWHLPFTNITHENGDPSLVTGGEALTNAIKLSVARCASTSYKTVEGFDMTLERAIALHDKLVGSTPLHASPCEHQAQADHAAWENDPAPLRSRSLRVGYPHRCGNLAPGWIQYRKILAGESL